MDGQPQAGQLKAMGAWQQLSGHQVSPLPEHLPRPSRQACIQDYRPPLPESSGASVGLIPLGAGPPGLDSDLERFSPHEDDLRSLDFSIEPPVAFPNIDLGNDTDIDRLSWDEDEERSPRYLRTQTTRDQESLLAALTKDRQCKEAAKTEEEGPSSPPPSPGVQAEHRHHVAGAKAGVGVLSQGGILWQGESTLGGRAPGEAL